MAQPQMLQVKLSRFDAQPWGFRLQGGVDFAQPLLVQKVNAGSLSEQAGLQPGDAVIKINDVDVFSMRHKDAQDIVVRSGNNFVITVQRGGSTWRPHVTPTGNVPQANSPYLQTVTKTSLAHHQQDSQHIGCGYNNSARPFGTDGGDGVKSIVNKQYNTPVGIYSDESIAETLSAQAEVLAGGVLGVNFKKNEKEYQADRSEVLKFLREEETGQSTPAFGQNNNNNGHYEHDAPQQQHHHQHQHQHQHQQHQHQQQQQQQVYQSNGATRHVSAPVNTPKPPSTGGLPTGQNICTECERLITGVFVRIKDKNLHVECFKCATCGTSLKNQGYYNFNNKLYCDIHAKQAAQSHPPPGTEGYVPVPIKPNTKLSANTISSALSSHGYGNNGYANGNSTPTPAPSELSSELPLPPPPSPTQLQLLQYETEEAPPTQQTTQQQPQQQQHTRTNSSLSSISSGSSSGVGSGSAALSPNSLVASSASNLSLDLESTRSPAHSRQASGSCNSLDAMPTTPPLPPPPAPAAQNENDMNTQNKNHNAYNQLLKQYSNKLQQQQQSNTNRHNNTAKPFATAAQQPHVAALTATLANQLKFNSHQAANAAAAAAATNEVDNTPLNMADEQSAAAIYGDAAAAAAACAMPCMQTSSMSAGQDQPFEYVTLTGNVIRSVQPPGKGANASYKVNQGYVRPFGAQSAPKSPVPMASYPPQQQQQQSPRAAAGANAYATLPRSNVGQQGRNVQRYNSFNNKQQQQHHQQQQQQQQYHQQQKQQYRNSYPAYGANNYSTQSYNNNNNNSYNRGAGGKGGAFGATSAPKRGRGILNKAAGPGVRIPLCNSCNVQIRGPFITALGRIWCPDHFICVNGNCRRPLQDIGFVEEKGDLYCEYCFEKFLAPTCSKCAGKIKGDCLNAIGKHFHPECFTCGQCGKVFGNTPFFLEDGNAYCEADWNELFTTKCFACGFPVEAGDRWVEALNHNYHSQCFNCTYCKQNLEGQSFYNKGGRPFCKNHAR
ncbi:PDZ and LIM domain protein Zasp isoform X12 [Drosophila busckii]|uniref:PDZ and LIM domain protein Zasp isoform X12 n=1 Tax=Drosophila busckii TaxID=30019 RepID=UPI00083F2E57|nr:PDZ and LIM domain protein Zasp isoform X12 [Drosophila busckii]